MIKGSIRSNGLWVPELYHPEKLCSCGPEGAKADLVPDTVWFLSIKEACCIHDFMYEVGGTEKDRRHADYVFLNNMNILIYQAHSFRLLKRLREKRAKLYFDAVREFGHKFFNYKEPKQGV